MFYIVEILTKNLIKVELSLNLMICEEFFLLSSVSC